MVLKNKLLVISLVIRSLLCVSVMAAQSVPKASKDTGAAKSAAKSCKDDATIDDESPSPGQVHTSSAKPQAAKSGAAIAAAAVSMPHEEPAQWLNKANQGAAHYHVATIQFRQNDVNSHFALYVGSSTAIYEGNDLGAMIRRLNELSPLPKGSRYYVAFDGFEPHRASNMVETMRNQQDLVDSSIWIEPVSGERRGWSGVLLQRVVATRGDVEIREMTGRPGWFEGTQRIAQQTGTGIRERLLRAQAKSRSLLVQFFQLFRDKVYATSGNSPTSLGEIVNGVRARMKQQFNLKDAEFKALVLDQTGGSFIVKLTNTETPDVRHPA